MKVVLTGASGVIGGGVLRQLLLRPEVSTVVSLSRRELPEDVTKNPKLQCLIVKNFASYPDDVLQAISGADACVWAVGGHISKVGGRDLARKLNIDYPHQLAEMFTTDTRLRPEGKKFRFVFTSGAFAISDMDQKAWFMGESRKMKGEIEHKLIELEKQNQDKIEVYFPRPSGVFEDSGLTRRLLQPLGAIGVNELGAAYAEIVVQGSKSQTILSDKLRSRGRELLKSA